MDFADEGGGRGRRRGGGDIVDIGGEFVVIVEVDDEALTGESHGGGVCVCEREREREREVKMKLYRNRIGKCGSKV